MSNKKMKWGYANTAAIVRSLQKDFFYRQQLQSDLKLILLDHLSKTSSFHDHDIYHFIRCRSLFEN
jgi:hypothetical protein